MEAIELEYERLACNALGLVHEFDRSDYSGRLLDLGQFRIIESPAATQLVVDLYLKKLRTLADEFEKGLRRRVQNARAAHTTKLRQIEQKYRELVATHAFLDFDDFVQFNKRGDSEERRTGFGFGRAAVKANARQELARLQRYVNYSSDYQGYCGYLEQSCPDLFRRLSKDLRALVKEEHHTTHTYILSTTKTGKSELLKALCFNYVQQPDYASVLILDPGGDMGRQIAQWPELASSERLIYIDPTLSEDHVPVINPFDVEGLTKRERGKLSGQIVAVLAGLVEGKLGGAISTAMEAVLYPSVRLLVDLPGSSIADIPRIMIDDPELLSLGKNSDDGRVADFFQNHFASVNQLTKKSVANKINSILGKGELHAILCGRNSIDLKAALNSRKIVVANLAKGALDRAESEVIGMLLVALAQSIGMERVHTPEHLRPQTHIIIDECQNFVTSELKDIIRETRKFGLAVTLAQQELGAEMPPMLRNTVVKTTNVKIAGRSDITETKQTGELVGVSAQDIRNCGPGQFYYRASNKPAFKLRVRSDRIKDAFAVDQETWNQTVAKQVERYYRPLQSAKATAKSASEAPLVAKHKFE